MVQLVFFFFKLLFIIRLSWFAENHYDLWSAFFRPPTFLWLVVWNIWIIFPYIGNFIIPTDELIFFRGVGQPPTRWLYIDDWGWLWMIIDCYWLIICRSTTWGICFSKILGHRNGHLQSRKSTVISFRRQRSMVDLPYLCLSIYIYIYTIIHILYIHR